MFFHKDEISFLEPEPKARAALLFHGMTGTPSEMVVLARRLHECGLDVICPPLPGHMKLREDVMKVTHDDWIDFSLRAFDKLSKKYSEILVGGVCVGGMLAMHLAARRNVRAVICISPVDELNGWGVSWIRRLLWLPLLTPFKFFLLYPDQATLGIRDEAVRKKIAEKMGKTGKALDCFPVIAIGEMRRLAASLKPQISKISSPVLLIHSELDDLSHISTSERLFEAIPSKHKRFVRVQNSYHLVILDKDKDFACEQTIKFIKDINI